jgi:hypothetical protein
MIKTKKLKLAREVIATLSTRKLVNVQGAGVTDSVAPVACEPSGILMCDPPQTRGCG